MMSSPFFPLYTPPPSTTTSFIKPDYQHSPTSPLPFSYIPQTPSPLRTSRNANLMPPPPTPTAPTKSSPLASIENVWTTTTTSSSTDENTFNFSPPLSTSNPFATKQSSSTSFSRRRTRSQSPITELTTRTTTARDRRKSLFLEQIRAKREDEKFEVRGEQVLRMDWARGEAERKARLARQAQRLTMMQMEEEGEDDVMEGNEDAGRPPSPTEEKELEELIRAHEEVEQERRRQDMLDNYHELLDDEVEDYLDDADEDYDQLFEEVVGIGAASGWSQSEGEEELSSRFVSPNHGQNQQQQLQHLQQGEGIIWPTLPPQPQQQGSLPASGSVENPTESMDMDMDTDMDMS